MKADVFLLLIETNNFKIYKYLTTWKPKSYRSVFSGTPCIYDPVHGIKKTSDPLSGWKRDVVVHKSGQSKKKWS